MSDLKLAKKLEKQRKASKQGLTAQYQNTDSCFSFYNGDMMDYKDRIQFVDPEGRRKRALVHFNKVQPNVDTVVGFMAQNRRKASFIARMSSSAGQQLYSKNMNALYDYHRENENADQVETEQDADMMICGYGATETDLSYIAGNATTDPNGEILKVRIHPKKVGWDARSRSKNLLDARWAFYWDDYDLKEALELFQGSVEEDFTRVGEEDQDNSGYEYNPWGGLYDKIRLEDCVEWAIKDEDMVRVYNHQWYEYETFYKAENPIYEATDPMDALFFKARLDVIKSEIKSQSPEGLETEDMFEFDPVAQVLVFDEATKRKLVQDFGELIQPVGFKRKVFKTAVYSGNHIFATFKSISQQGFSIKFKTGIYNEQGQFWTGMVNPMMEPQKYQDKALTELLFTIAANSKGGVMVEEDAVEDIDDFSSKWSKTDAVITVASGALGNGKIQQKAQGAVPTGLEGIIQLTAQSISDNGVNPEFMGNMREDAQSGILYKRQIRQCISKMARYFDSITLYQKEDARLHGDLIPVWIENNEGQWVRITGEDGADEFEQITKDMLAPEYDVSIQEAQKTPEDQQETAILLGGMADKYLSIGDAATAKAIHAESIRFLPLDGDVRNRIVQFLQPQEEDPRIAQLQAIIEQLQSEAAQAEVNKKNADAKYSEARAIQTMANIEAIKAKIPQTNAQTVKTLEEARKTAAETHMAENAPDENISVGV